jgi:hypothetical protein
MIALAIVDYRCQFVGSETAHEQVTPHALDKRSGLLTFLPRLFSREGHTSVVIRCQAIIQTLPEMARPFPFDFPCTDEMAAKHPPDRGVARCCHVVHEQRCLGSVQYGVISTRYSILAVVSFQ